MSNLSTREFKIQMKNLKVSLEDFIIRLEKKYSDFDHYEIKYDILNNEEDVPSEIHITLSGTEYYYLGLWRLHQLFNRTVEFEKDISELYLQ